MEEIEQEASVNAETITEHSTLLANYANKHKDFMPLMYDMFVELQCVIDKYKVKKEELPFTEAALTEFLAMIEDSKAFANEVNGVSND